jgi:hypothetical protein
LLTFAIFKIIFFNIPLHIFKNVISQAVFSYRDGYPLGIWDYLCHSWCFVFNLPMTNWLRMKYGKA